MPVPSHWLLDESLRRGMDTMIVIKKVDIKCSYYLNGCAKINMRNGVKIWNVRDISIYI